MQRTPPRSLSAESSRNQLSSLGQQRTRDPSQPTHVRNENSFSRKPAQTKSKSSSTYLDCPSLWRSFWHRGAPTSFNNCFYPISWFFLIIHLILSWRVFDLSSWASTPVCPTWDLQCRSIAWPLQDAMYKAATYLIGPLTWYNLFYHEYGHQPPVNTPHLRPYRRIHPRKWALLDFNHPSDGFVHFTIHHPAKIQQDVPRFVESQVLTSTWDSDDWAIYYPSVFELRDDINDSIFISLETAS